MKTVKLIVAMVAITLTLAACGGENKSENQADSTGADTSLTDSTYMDTTSNNGTADTTTNAPTDAAH